MTKYKINYNNDVYFKHSLSQSDEESERLRRTIITNQFGIGYKTLKIKNPEILPVHIGGKRVVLDVLLENEIGEQIDLEMQVSTLDEFMQKRFQLYGARGLSEQLSSGDDYRKLKKVYQIIFIKDIFDKDRLFDCFTSKNDFGEEEPFNLIHRYYVYMPYINEIAKTKSFEEFTDFEKMVYIYQNNLEFDILEVEKGTDCNLSEDPIVKIMVNKMSKLIVDPDLRAYALSAEMGEAQYKHDQRVLREMREEVEKAQAELEKAQEEFEKAQVEFEKSQVEFEKSQVEFEKSQAEVKKVQEELVLEKEKVEKEKKELISKKNEIIVSMMKKFGCSEEEAREILGEK